MLVVAPSGREIRFDDAFGQKGNRYSRSFACESSLALVRDVIYDEYTLPRNDRTLLVSVYSLQEVLYNEYIYLLLLYICIIRFS